MADYCIRCGIPLAIGNETDFCSEHGGPGAAPDAQKHCPFCSELILATAKKCKHCGEFLDRSKSQNPQGVVQPGHHKRSDMICPNPRCGYVGRPRKVARGSMIVGFVLLCFLVVPGLLYFMFKRGHRYLCPRCGLQIRVDN